jgi:hypothetical protein
VSRSIEGTHSLLLNITTQKTQMIRDHTHYYSTAEPEGPVQDKAPIRLNLMTVPFAGISCDVIVFIYNNTALS